MFFVRLPEIGLGNVGPAGRLRNVEMAQLFFPEVVLVGTLLRGFPAWVHGHANPCSRVAEQVVNGHQHGIGYWRSEEVCPVVGVDLLAFRSLA